MDVLIKLSKNVDIMSLTFFIKFIYFYLLRTFFDFKKSKV